MTLKTTKKTHKLILKIVRKLRLPVKRLTGKTLSTQLLITLGREGQETRIFFY